ncbi:MAG TPA: hypothetical protein VFX59_24725 [Polyangiales bacterium]|nr:hypothetical protein [Polyangiales bacterium]
MPRHHQPVACRLDQREHFLIWFSDDEGKDGVVLTPERQLLCTASEAALRERARSLGITFVGELSSYDLDAVEAWTRTRDPDAIDCKLLLDAWNWLGDVTSSLRSRADLFVAADAKLNKVYDKLFHGNNLPAVTAPREHYEPTWSASEASDLAALLRLGLQLFRAAR